MKIGFYSPLPPARTGVAEYSLALKQELQRSDSVEVNATEADVFLYHLGNNQLHLPIYKKALETPGIVVLHDAVLQHFFLGSLDEERYTAEFAHNYGDWSRGFARTLWRDRSRSASDARYFEYPMLKRIAQASRAVIVHNPGAAALVRAHAPQTKIHEIPHLFDPPPPVTQSETEALRTQLGVQPGVFLLGVFGHLRESKRLPAVLRATRNIPNVQLLVCGTFASPDLARALEPELAGQKIIRVDYLADAHWWRHAACVDACVNLRYPPAGETSGIAIRLMGIGKPVIVSAGAETSHFPPGACIPIETGHGEEDMLADVVCWLSRNRADAQAIGERAAEYIGRVHAVDAVANLYRKYLTECLGRSA